MSRDFTDNNYALLLDVTVKGIIEVNWWYCFMATHETARVQLITGLDWTGLD